MTNFYVGVDLGQAQDYSAIGVLEDVRTPEGEHGHKRVYHARHLQRVPLGTPYPDVVDQVAEILRSPALGQQGVLALDATGVGIPVVDLFRERGLNPIAVTITGGDAVTRDGPNWHVPKRDLVSTLQVLLQNGRLKFAEGLPEVATLVKEMLAFQVKIDLKTAHDSYGSWREGSHDDLLLAVGIAAYIAESCGGVSMADVDDGNWVPNRWNIEQSHEAGDVSDWPTGGRWTIKP